ncbi:MAG: hypothetical protein ABI589_10210 [Burkholderiales bacterium]
MNNIPAPGFRIARLAAVSLLAAAVLSACVVAPAPRRGAYPVQEVVVESNLPPPAPYTEVIPAPPYTGAVWVGGYWGWSGGRHQWVPGRWAQPRPGYAWRPHRWEPAARGGWVLRGGFWAR